MTTTRTAVICAGTAGPLALWINRCLEALRLLAAVTAQTVGHGPSGAAL